MSSPISSLGRSWKLMTANKTNILLSAIPVLFGIILYAFAGMQFYSYVAGQGESVISGYISSDTLGSVVAFVLKAILTIMIFFFTNWTFVMVVTIFAGPFNDILSSRIEKQIKHEELWNLSESLKLVGAKFFANLFNELKKISFIIFVGLIAFIIGYIPLLTPISIFLAILLLAVGFLDYSWSRHSVSFRSCVGDVRKHLIRYSIGGGVFFLLVSVPVVNLIVPPLATCYFTLLWVRNHEVSYQTA